MIFNMTGGGSNPLNFQVKTYPSETELKADNPKENTIGVITTTTMTSWVFSAKEPTEPEVGMVWISVGTSSAAEFNALKKNTLQVYPIGAKQYVSGKWEKVGVYIYSNGEWDDLAIYLFDYGTLGHQWQAKALLHDDASSSSIAYAPTVTNNDDGSVTITQTGASSGKTRRGGYLLNELIDFTDIETVVFSYDVVEATSFEFGLSVLPEGYNDYKEDALAYYITNQSTSLVGVINLDVSNVNEKGYIFISTYASNSHTLKIKLKEVYCN